MTAAPDEILHVSDLRVHFATRGGFGRRAVVRAVDGVSFAVRRGTTFGIVGESGCGKSTLSRALLRLIPATSGNVRFDGRDVLGLTGLELRRYRRDVQIVFQDPAGSLNPRMRVGEIVGEALTVHGLAATRNARDEIVADMLGRVGLSADDRKRYPHEFSGGQRQRIGIARALALRPRLVICDEPVSALDVSIQSQILNLLRDLQDGFGLSYLFIAHNLAVMRQFCDEIAVMHQGCFVEHGATGELFGNPRHPYTQALLDSAPRLRPRADRRDARDGELGDGFQAKLIEILCDRGDRAVLLAAHAERLQSTHAAAPRTAGLESFMPESVVTAPPHAAPAADRVDVLRWVCLVFALFGWWLSAELTRQSLGHAGGSMLVQALCAGDSAGGNCRSLIASEWGSVPISPSPGAPRMPVAAFGMGYFAAIALWLVFVGLPRRGQWRWLWHVPLLLFLLVGAISSATLLAVMGMLLQRWCLACTAVHALNLGLLLLVIGEIVFRPRINEEVGRLGVSAAVAALAASAMILLLHLSIVFTLVFSRSVGPLQEAHNKIVRDPAFAKWQYERQTPVEFPPDDWVANEGPANAPNTIVFFSDFQCPACRKAHTLLKDTLAERPDQFRVIYRHYPLSIACNPHVPASRHPAACGAALAAEAALAAGGAAAGKAMRDRLYERQDETRPAAFARWAEEFGVDATKYADAVASPETAGRITRDVDLAKSVGITATPVIFVNGRRFDYWMNDAAWREALGLPAQAAASKPAK